MGGENDRVRIEYLRDELRRERARREAAERANRTLLAELDRVRDFLTSLPEFDCSLETTVAVQEFLLTAPHVARKT